MLNFSKSLKLALATVLPSRCLVCGAPNAGTELCHRCLPELRNAAIESRCIRCFGELVEFSESQQCVACQIYPLPFFAIRYLWDYSANARDIINSMKYAPSFALCKLAGRYLAQQVPAFYPKLDWDIIVPIPSSPRSLRKRLFNQCVVIANAMRLSLGPLISATLETEALYYARLAKTQASLPLARRVNNVSCIFKTRPKLLKDRKVLLIDDVITTGSTIAAAGRELMQAGVARIDVLALARAQTWQGSRQKIYLHYSKKGRN